LGRSSWLTCGKLHDKVIAEANQVAAPGGKITAQQAAILKGNLPVVQRRSVFQNQMARKEFVRDQDYLMKQWEINTARMWPEGATPHHVIPLESGGANKWWILCRREVSCQITRSPEYLGLMRPAGF